MSLNSPLHFRERFPDEFLVVRADGLEAGQVLPGVIVLQLLPLLRKAGHVVPAVVGAVHLRALGVDVFLADSGKALDGNRYKKI